MKKTELIEKMEISERKREFSSHINPPNEKNILQVANDYDYMQKGFLVQSGCLVGKGLFNLAKVVIPPFCKLKVIGKNNLKGIKGAIITSNHINNIDCVLIKKAVGRHKLRITVATFNNLKSLLGSCMRGAGVMPIGENITAMKHFSTAISNYLEQNNLILFYPEGSLWWCYEKPRPLINGAYYYATKNNVPIIPMFFTFKNLKQRKDGTFKKQFILHISKPIYPNKLLSVKQNIEYMKNQNFEVNKQIYESFYGKKLVYLPEID